MIEYFNAAAERILPLKPRPVLAVLVDAAFMVIGLVLLGLLGMLIALVISPLLGYLSPLGGLLVLVALALLVRSVRRSRALIAVNYLEQAARLNLPLPAMLAAAESAEHGRMRRRLHHLRIALESGIPVSVSLRIYAPGIPARVVGLVECGEHLGRLPQTLTRVIHQQRPNTDRNTMNGIMLRWYPIAMLACVILTAAAVNVFVFPKLMAIFKDFHEPLPPLTRATIAVSNHIALPVIVIGIFALAGFCGRMLSELLPFPRFRFGLLKGVVDRLTWITPVLRNAVRSRGLADLCHVMADAMEIGQPMDRALSEAADAMPNRVLEKRVRRWSEHLTSGALPADAARRAGMPALLVGMLGTTRDTAAAKDVFGFLARYYENRSGAAAAFMQAAAVPAMVAVLAAIVAVIALSVFLPLIQLIDHLSSTSRGVL